MACQALHSHLLLGLMMIHAAIIVYLFVSEMYILYPHKTSTSTDITPTKTTVASLSSKENDLDINGLKVIVAMGAHIVCFINVIGALVVNNVTAAARRLPPSVIVVTLIFSLIFNVAGALCLWLHDAPHHPGGISRTVRGCMILSFTTIGYTAIVMVVYCARSPKHDSLRGHSAEGIQSDQLSREKTKSKEKGEQKSKDEDKSKKAKKDVQLEPSPVDYWSNPAPEGTKGGGFIVPPPPPTGSPPKPNPAAMPPPPGGASEGKKEGEGLYENLEVPPGFVAPPPPPPPPP